MKTLEVTVEYLGYPVKIRGGRVFLPFFGTTYYNQTMYWEYSEAPLSKLSDGLYKFLRENRLI